MTHKIFLVFGFEYLELGGLQSSVAKLPPPLIIQIKREKERKSFLTKGQKRREKERETQHMEMQVTANRAEEETGKRKKKKKTSE